MRKRGPDWPIAFWTRSQHWMAVAAAITLATAGCATLGRAILSEPVVSLKNVQVTGLDLTGGSLDIVLGVYNPNQLPIDATSLTYRVSVDSVPLGSGTSSATFTVKDRDSTDVHLPLQFSWSGVGNAARELIGQGAVNYRVTGDLGVNSPIGSLTLPYDRQGRFSAVSVSPSRQ